MHNSVWENKEKTMYDYQLNGQEHWQQLIREADEYRQARDAQMNNKKSSSTLRNLLANILGSATR